MISKNEEEYEKELVKDGSYSYPNPYYNEANKDNTDAEDLSDLKYRLRKF